VLGTFGGRVGGWLVMRRGGAACTCYGLDASCAVRDGVLWCIVSYSLSSIASADPSRLDEPIGGP
jgi:hypothetical protein